MPLRFPPITDFLPTGQVPDLHSTNENTEAQDCEPLALGHTMLETSVGAGF